MSINPNKPGVYTAAQMAKHARYVEVQARKHAINVGRSGELITKLQLHDALTAESWRVADPKFPLSYKTGFAHGYCHIGCIEGANYFKQVLPHKATLELVCAPPQDSWCVICGGFF